MSDHIIAVGLLAAILLLLMAIFRMLYRTLKRLNHRRHSHKRRSPQSTQKSGSPFSLISVGALGSGIASCAQCQSGRLTSFNWKYAGTHTKKDLPAQDAFVLQQKLRAGSLYRCKGCGLPWHLDAQEEMMSVVPADRVDLILEWNNGPILLSQEYVQRLERIGATPPDSYGNGRQHKRTPCSVTTTGGERIDLAVVSIQAHAPFETHRNYRLGTEIARLDESPYALPLDVRIATSRAEEIRMGLAPTIIEMTDGKRFTLNWTTHFLVKEGYRAADARVAEGNLLPMPEIADEPKEIIYFVVDG